MAQAASNIDMAKAQKTAEQVFGLLGGALVSAMIYLGDRLGFYHAMQSGDPMTSGELAEKMGLHERWVREWLQGQASAGLIDYKGDGRFALSAEAALVLADENSPLFLAGGFCALPAQMAILERLPESFRTGLGLPYDALGPDGARGVERLLAPWYRTQLVPVALPKLDGVVPKLRAGARVADVGCGGGIAAIEMAKAFPQSMFHGYDISKYALERAEANKAQARLTNVTFHNASQEPLPSDASFDFISTFDCLHDMAHPDVIVAAIRKALKPDGTWIIADIHGQPTFEQNLTDNPLAPLMYGFSVLCCMSSAMSEPGGAGLGTLGFPEPVARRMVAEAGFTRFKSHDFDNPINAYYEVRP
ncbi:MAG: methyltransferase domain-containing protein [Deltaproteobacteria bacterium]|nr:methyltransferase domain-containing protein [Deltaproteobacteria bacterium]